LIEKTHEVYLCAIAPIFEADAPEPVKVGKVSVSLAEILTLDEALANLAILPVDVDGKVGRCSYDTNQRCERWL
jgi:hypothetical protein